MSLKRLCLTALALLLLPLGAGEAAAQGQTTGGIRGQVLSTEGAPVASAQVVAINTETGLRRGVLANDEGRFTIPLLPPGIYRLEAQSIGFATAAADELNVRIGEITPVRVELSPEAVAIEGVVARGDRARVDPSQGGVWQTVTPEQVESLPLAGRDFTDLIKLSPLVSPQPGIGTGGQFSIAGARTSGTNVQIDGVDANNAFFGENRGSSRTPFAFSLESIKELQIITNGFDVEYGNYVGGVVNAVTKGGTNELKGGGFLFHRNEALTAEDFEGNAPTDYSVYQFGANASGPIIRDKMHFFVSADAQLKEQPIFAGAEFEPVVIDQVVDALEAKGIQDADQFFGEFAQEENNLVLFGRLDWQMGDNNRLTLRQNYSTFEQTNDRISQEEAITHGGPFQNESWSTVLELNSVLSSKAFNTVRFQYSDEDRPRVPNEPGGFLPEIGIEFGRDELEFGGDGIIFRNRLVEEKFQFIDNFTYQLGDHTIKIGTNNTYANTANTFWLLGNGSFGFRNLDDFLSDRPTTFFRLTRACPVPLEPNAAGERVICPDPDVPFAEFGNLEWSVYLQDDWQVTDRLIVTPGLRYGGTTFFDEPSELPEVEQAFGIPTGVTPDFSGLSPRLAFTYNVTGDDSKVVRGGLGVLVGRAPTVLIGNVFQTERPLLSVFCATFFGDPERGPPAFNLGELLEDPQGLNNPFACAGGQGLGGRPQHTVFGESFELPRTFKANVGYETVVTEDLRLGVDLIYGQTWNNFTVEDRNLQQPQFFLSEGDRPVFVAADRFEPSEDAGSARLLTRDFNEIFVNVSEGEARSLSMALEADQQIRDDLVFGVRYAYTRAFDNSSFSCCTSSGALEDTPTAGNPNFVGDIGDEIDGAWGPSDFERRHSITGNFVYEGPWGIKSSAIFRAQSGTPFTPVVSGDINADGIEFNDRAFVGRELRFATPEDAALFDELLAENECLADQLGQIVTRNSCRNPWFTSLDLRLAKWIDTFGGQRAELVLDMFNLLNGLNSDWGRFLAVSGRETNLLEAEGFDSETQEIIYTVNPEFGEAEPVGFDPFQFQVQVGLRYRF